MLERLEKLKASESKFNTYSFNRFISLLHGEIERLSIALTLQKKRLYGARKNLKSIKEFLSAFEEQTKNESCHLQKNNIKDIES